MVDWSVLTGRYHRTFLGLPDADSREGETEGAVLSLMWSEWKRVYGPQELARDSLLPADWIETSRVRLGLEASELDVVLDEAARVLAPAAGKPADELGAALRARASDGHISLGEGVSIPHAPIAGLERPLAALVTTKEPVDVAGDKADLFFVLLAPATDPRRHLLSLAHVGRICHDDKVLSTLRAASDPAAVVAILLQSEERFEAHPAPRGDARLLAILELASFEQVERVVEILDEGVTHPVVLSDRDGAPYETLRAALRLPRSRRLALLSIEERDKNVLAGLMAELSRLWPNEEQVRVHILRPEIALPSHTNDADEGS